MFCTQTFFYREDLAIKTFTKIGGGQITYRVVRQETLSPKGHDGHREQTLEMNVNNIGADSMLSVCLHAFVIGM